MPVVIMIGGYPIPAAVVRLKCVMRPALTSISARHHNILPVESECPDLRGVCIIDSRLERPRSRRRLSRRTGLRKRILNVRIAFDARHVGPGSQHLGDLAAALH